MSASKDKTIEFDRLSRRIDGRLITPSDDDYASSSRLFYPMVTGKPAAVVRVASATDVSAVIGEAASRGLELAVRSGGHSLAGHSTVDDGIVIDVRDLNTLEIDTASRTAWAGSGLTAVDFTLGAAKHGLGVGFGDTGSVGIGGITLGGGVGFLVRRYGLTIDSLLAAEVVTADGQILRTGAESHPDLFWALRGGGGNFGVVTRFKFALQSIDPFVGGFLILPASDDAVEGFIELSESAPEELSTIANVMSAPPMPFIPDELVGTTMVMGMIAWCGEIEPGMRMMDRFRELGEPVFDTLGAQPYTEMYPPEDVEYVPTAVARTGFTDSLDSRKIRALVSEIEASDAPMRVVQLRVLGGAMARMPSDATAFAHRDRKLMVNTAAFYESEEDRPIREIWVANLAKILTDGEIDGYIGFLGDEGGDRVRAAYPGSTWDRLRRVKAEYDPENLFHRNQNIPPAD